MMRGSGGQSQSEGLYTQQYLSAFAVCFSFVQDVRSLGRKNIFFLDKLNNNSK